MEEGICRPFGGLQIIEEDRPTAHTSATRKTKTKTRRPPQIPEGTGTDMLANDKIESDDEAQPKIRVDDRAAKVFDALFFTPSAQSRAGETNWADFLHAMVTAGFTAERLGGSAWQFTPTSKPDVSRAIQFHEPHPTSKVPFLMARSMGRRLWRAYGWCADSFEVSA